MQGLTWSSIKKNPSLIPLFACGIVGAFGAVGYLMRLAIKSPEVTWSPKKNPNPENYYKDKQYKLYSSVEFDKIEKAKVPEY
ncbi:hypothetical protein PV325_008440 [Microctonus aethiopoides]|uniref:NADH dehydrogenase [ubiquinone] 1 alpha subcomplex subunit 4 n=1 Tax=Microctonus aethiopoides TaxID=144406 RepID=A0AA39F740_9HYME|nr:hypothetical protein PV325_008440 [Microctonus aethiopoides]KAK0096933.1 hypothetical protein PV326_003827 [Microctonus aethiopoides]KAK0164167.1 hypothetical protein PV328_002826 [Microctonus aethiopoides]